jgi:hypothetical protein
MRQADGATGIGHAECPSRHWPRAVSRLCWTKAARRPHLPCRETTMIRRALLALSASIAFAAPTAVLPTAAKGQSAEETAFVMALMRGMNQLSVRFDREVCGFVLRDADGRYSSTKVSWGGAASCASLAARSPASSRCRRGTPMPPGPAATTARCPRSRTWRATCPWASTAGSRRPADACGSSMARPARCARSADAAAFRWIRASYPRNMGPSPRAVPRRALRAVRAVALG